MKARILVVEDDTHIALGLKEVLGSEGYGICTCERGDEALKAVARELPDLILLDVMLPGASGYEICRELRAAGKTVPILMLTAKGQELDIVVGLDLGADDYLVKPFGVRELLSRIQALLRRSGPGSGAREGKDPEAGFAIGDALIDSKRFEIRRGSERIELSAKELKLLEFLHRHAGNVMSRDRLLIEVWGYHYHGTTRTLDQVIVQLRKKLGDDAHQARHLQTVHGVGYRLVL